MFNKLSERFYFEKTEIKDSFALLRLESVIFMELLGKRITFEHIEIRHGCF
jgi:hypothetical protein